MRGSGIPQSQICPLWKLLELLSNTKAESKEDSLTMVIQNQEECKHMSLVFAEVPGSRRSYVLLANKAFKHLVSTWC